ncbi:MAG: hypothetical protein KatS3mg101_1031 [Patescibacteria group bacterium]|nr:MAG: hypothetical protein KatS3mg101_1031 [Patescibacteria group bacterium]
MQPTYKEEWIVKVGKEAFVLDERQIVVLKEAMKTNNRWVSFEKFIISIPHIECIYLNRREVANQLPEGKKEDENFKPIPSEKWKKMKEEIYQKAGRSVA